MSAEARQDFDCFGGRVAVSMRGEEGEARLALARETLRDAHRRLSRFEPDSELSRMNGDPRRVIPASPLLRRLVIAAYTAGELSGGLVDATLLDEIERLGYIDSVAPGQGPPPGNGAGRAPASPSPREGWRALAVDEEAGCVVRPPGVRLDRGGIATGLLADIVGEQLADARVFAVDCCGDIRFGGRAGLVRRVKVESPFGGAPVHELTLREGAVATSGITRRTWLGPGGRAAHQIIDPGTGAPAATGAVQVTALAPSALHAEVFAKAALLAGPEGAEPWLPFGGVVVLEDGGIEVFEGGDLPGTQ